MFYSLRLVGVKQLIVNKEFYKKVGEMGQELKEILSEEKYSKISLLFLQRPFTGNYIRFHECMVNNLSVHDTVILCYKSEDKYLIDMLYDEYQNKKYLSHYENESIVDNIIMKQIVEKIFLNK